MTEEVLMIDFLSGITCRDGRHFMELYCRDEDDKRVCIVLPATMKCGEEKEDCESCAKREECEIDEPVVDLGRKLIIKR